MEKLAVSSVMWSGSNGCVWAELQEDLMAVPSFFKNKPKQATKPNRQENKL